MPSLVARVAFLLALAIPFVRRIVSALSKSPPASSSARLQSIMPALVFSRSCLTILGSIAVLVLIGLKSDCWRRPLTKRKRRPFRFVRGCALRRSPTQSRRPAFAAQSESRESRRRFLESDNRSFPDRRWYRQPQRPEY